MDQNKGIKMAVAEQLYLFEEPEIYRQSREIAELKSEVSRLRKGMFARHTELERLYVELYDRLEQLEKR